jgi:hypothetical protein
MRKNTHGNACSAPAQGEPVYLHPDRPEGERGPIIGERRGTSTSERALRAQKPPKLQRAGRFVMFYFDDLDTAAFQSLDCVARALMIELDRRFDGQNNGQVELPIKVAARRLHVGKDAITAAFRTLEARRFLIRRVTGKFAPGARTAAKWELTWRWRPEGQEPSRSFREWRPE